MYPQTHVYFAETILGRRSDQISLGSILPDMIIGGCFDHCEAHSKGTEIYTFLRRYHSLLDFGNAVLTHGFVPKGLDYYGDEKYQDFEKGYSFEKAKPFISKTIEACNIPPEMGWWKAHNIIEMGVEVLVSSLDCYGVRIERAFSNHSLVSEVGEMLSCLWKGHDLKFANRVERFVGFVEFGRATAESMAQKYQFQMQFKHQVEIDTKKVARLIYRAAERVSGDLNVFFDTVACLVNEDMAVIMK